MIANTLPTVLQLSLCWPHWKAVTPILPQAIVPHLLSDQSCFLGVQGNVQACPPEPEWAPVSPAGQEWFNDSGHGRKRCKKIQSCKPHLPTTEICRISESQIVQWIIF